MKRPVLWLAGLGLVAASWVIGPALASSLNGATRTLATGNATVLRCDSDGVSTVFNYQAISPYPVISVTVFGIASACDGKTLSVVVNNGLLSSSGSVAVPGGGSATVTLALPVAETDATQTEISIT
jgi:hypothetical protein